LAFANEGQTYNTLQYSLTAFSPYPEFGLKPSILIPRSKPNRLQSATRYRIVFQIAVMQKGQSLDAFFTINTSKT
jgi:hypothetical protein